MDVKGAASVFLFLPRNGGRSGSTTFLTMGMLLATFAEEKENAFNSVIRTLEPKGGSSVLARALVMRSELYCESGRYQDALTDARQALSMPTTVQVGRRACRLQADAHTSLGQIDDALRCLQDWMNQDPAFRSKIGAEIERVRRLKNA